MFTQYRVKHGIPDLWQERFSHLRSTSIAGLMHSSRQEETVFNSGHLMGIVVPQ
jgi:hypothetical protein